jgi:hypothetical protein
LYFWKRGSSSDLYVGARFFWSALRVKNVWAYVKTGAIYAAAFGLLIFGLGFDRAAGGGGRVWRPSSQYRGNIESYHDQSL